jgi:hypothetical protein
MSLAELATELAIALIIIAILIGGIASNIFFSVNRTWNGSGSFAEANRTYTWDATSNLIWPYIFPLCLAALLVGILYHMYKKSID